MDPIYKSVTAICLACDRKACLSNISTAKRSTHIEKNVSESIIEHENHERDRDMSDKRKKNRIPEDPNTITTEHVMKCLVVLHAILYTTQNDGKYFTYI